jgi:hypothetical protein
VPDQNDIVQIVVEKKRLDVFDVGLEIDLGTEEMGTFPEPREGRRHDAVPEANESRHKLLPTPAAMPAAVHENKRRGL